MAIHRINSRLFVAVLPLGMGLALLSLSEFARAQAPPRADDPRPGVVNPQPSAAARQPAAPKASVTPQLPTVPGTETSGEFKQQLIEQNRATARTANQLNRDTQQEARQVVEAQRNAAAAAASGANSATANAGLQANGNVAAPTIRAADMGVWFRNEPGSRGLTVVDLSPSGAFAGAGLREGDIVTTLNGQTIASEAQFVQLLHSPNAASSLANLVVLRNGQPQMLSVQPAAIMQRIVAYDPLFLAGLTLDPNNPNQAVVQQVFPRTSAYYAGLRTGDIITSVEGNPIASSSALAQALQNRANMLDLQVSRNGQTRQLSLERIGRTHTVSGGIGGAAENSAGRANTTNQIELSGLSTSGGVSAAGANTIGSTVPGNTGGSTLLPSTGAPLGPTVNPGQLPNAAANPTTTTGIPRGPGAVGGFSGVPNANSVPAAASGSVGGTGAFPGGAGSTAGPSGLATGGGGVGTAGAASASGAGAGGAGTSAGASGTTSGTAGGSGPGGAGGSGAGGSGAGGSGGGGAGGT